MEWAKAFGGLSWFVLRAKTHDTELAFQVWFPAGGQNSVNGSKHVFSSDPGRVSCGTQREQPTRGDAGLMPKVWGPLPRKYACGSLTLDLWSFVVPKRSKEGLGKMEK